MIVDAIRSRLEKMEERSMKVGFIGMDVRLNRVMNEIEEILLEMEYAQNRCNTCPYHETYRGVESIDRCNKYSTKKTARPIHLCKEICDYEHERDDVK